jgi:very-short-patch-repair endonuclease
LHSTKSRKTDVLASIDERWNLRPNLAGDLEATRQGLTVERAAINDYLDALHGHVGALRVSLHDAIWNELYLRSQIQPHVQTLDRLEIRDADSIGPTRRLEVKRICDVFEELARAIVREHNALDGHPWFGLRSDDTSAEGRRTLLESFNECKNNLSILHEAVVDHCRALNLIEPASVEELDSYVAFVERFRSIRMDADLGDSLDERSRSALCEPPASLVLERFAQNLANQSAIEQRWGQDLLKRFVGQLDQVEVAAADALDLCEKQAQIQNLIPRAEVLDNRAIALTELHSRLAEIAQALHLDSNLEAELLPVLDNLAEHAIAMEDAAKPHWRPELGDAGFRAKAATVVENGQAVAQRFARVKDQLDFTETEPAEQFRSMGRKLRSAGILWFFDSEIRNARKEYKGRARSSPLRTNAEVANLFIELADVLEARIAYAQDFEAQNVLGQLFRGADSDFDAVSAAISWSETLLADLEHRGRLGALLSQRVFDMKLQSLGLLSAAKHDRVYESAIAAISDGRGTDRLHELSAEAKSDASRLNAAAAMFEQLGLDRTHYLETVHELVRDSKQLRQITLTLDGDGTAHTLLARRFHGSATSPEDVECLFNFAKAVGEAKLSDSMRRRVAATKPHQLVLQSKTFLEGRDAGERASTILGAAVATGLLDKCRQSLDAIASTLEAALRRADLLDEWLRFQTLRSQVADGTGSALLNAFEETLTVAPPMPLALAYEYLVVRTNIIQAMNSRPILQRMTGSTLEAARRRFAQLDQQFLELSRVTLARELLQRFVDRGNGTGPKSSFTGASLIRSELTKQKRHIPIRDLIRRSGLALQQLKPCWMMSPLSVAQFIAGHSVRFDLIVIDEASQMRPEDAIGALVRGDRVIVVGDQKQLPPTAFFDRAVEMTPEEIEEGDVVDAESILDETLRKFGSPRQLRVHYRSHYESLIAFSNHYFYNDSLIIYPSPNSAAGEGGVRSHFADGLYKSSLNVKEADGLLDAALTFMRGNPDLSAGIVTMNYAQREYINEELERRIAQDDQAAEYIAKWEPTLYPFFVKNLESVQGDERDVIFISTVYGPETHGGKVAQRFGPILGPAGWRRLNVLFTRARQRVELFTSMRPSDIPVGESAGRGVQALRNYLEYAETRRLETGIGCRRDPDSDFELAVARALTRRGFHVDFQIGVAHCFIDIGVKNPRTGTYILGVECDGATYHSSRYARERDRIREDKLRSLGWNLYRIWSTDWFANPERETEELARVISRLLLEQSTAEPEAS